MTEYKEIVQQQANLLAAEEWAKGVSGIHVHQMSCGLIGSKSSTLKRVLNEQRGSLWNSPAQAVPIVGGVRLQPRLLVFSAQLRLLIYLWTCDTKPHQHF